MIRREIGSEYWDAVGKNGNADLHLFSQSKVQFFLSGRTALHAILSDIQKKRPCGRAYLPAYCCDSMVDPFLRCGMEVAFYPVCAEKGFRPVIDPEYPCDVVLTMDYFGYEGAAVKLPRAIHIHDITHSLLSRPAYNEADYCFGSLRKWGPVAAAGFAWSKTGALDAPACPAGGNVFASLRDHGYALKAAYMKGETDDKQSFLKLFAQAEELLDRDYIGYGADSASLTNAGLIAAGKQKRIENAAWLTEALRSCSVAAPVYAGIGERDVPLFVPVLVKSGLRSALRAFLIEREVYCPVHWPVHSGIRNELYESELSLICDQRYGLNDMERQISLIREFEERAGLLT